MYEQGITIASALSDLGKDSGFGEIATEGAAERAVLKLLAARPAGARTPARASPGMRDPMPM